MTAKVKHTYHFDAPPDRVIEVLCSEAFQVGYDESRDDVKETAFAYTERSGDDLTFEVRSTEYERSMMGSIDRSKTTNAVTTNRWRAADRTLSWTYKGAGGDHFDLRGTYKVVPDGDGTRVDFETLIDVRVPIIGGKIAKMVAKELEKSVVLFDELFKRHLTEA